MRLARVVECSRAVGATRSRRRKVAHLTDLLRACAPEELAIALPYLSGRLPQGRIGVGWATVRDLDPGSATELDPLELREVDAVMDDVAATRGAGSKARRGQLLGGLMARATAEERRFLGDLILGVLRQGALDGVMAEAVAAAFEVPADGVRRAAMLAGDVTCVALAVRADGPGALGRFRLSPFSPILPMLATPADDVEAALERLGEAAFELKLDGARVQVHRDGSEVRVYSRGLDDVTARVPELVEVVAAMPARRLVLDGEAIALRADGSPLPFQTTMRRFGRKKDVEAARARLPLTGFFFDCLLLDDDDLLDRPLAERIRALRDLVPEAGRVPTRITGDPAEARRFFDDAVGRGHEGLMAKALDQGYEAGRRGFGWLKLKPAHTMDLVVLAVEWGSGRRRGWLSNLHLGARDPRTGAFVMLGKTFKGMTDAMLAWQTERLLALEVAREGHVVHVRPELVVEIAFSDVQASPHYAGGLALRFARVKRYRADKTADQVETVDAVRALLPRPG